MAPNLHDAIVGAYTSASAVALNVAAVIVLVTGVLVICEMTWAANKSTSPDLPHPTGVPR